MTKHVQAYGFPISPFLVADSPEWLVRDLRSDHAGETGAVAIYRGILAVSLDPQVRAFARKHLETEKRHLTLISSLLPRRYRSVLLPVWQMAGFLTGFLPSLFGARAVFATIDGVETYVCRHYEAQIVRLRSEEIFSSVRILLEDCQADEGEHRDEARELFSAEPGSLARAWQQLVIRGSGLAVAAARRL